MNNRSLTIRIFIIVTIIIFSARLFSIQIADEEYKSKAEENIVHKIIRYPYRGLIYDRNRQLLVHNDPVFDVMIIPKEFDLKDSVAIKSLLSISQETFDEKYQKARRYSSILPSIFYEKLSKVDFARIQDRIIDFDGITIQPRTVRSYEHRSLANALGYVGEVNARQVRRDTTNYYKSGDLIGITGIEKIYERYLRGRRGMSFKTVNVRGQIVGSFRNGEYDTVPVPGQEIQLTIDLELQQYAEKLMEGKIGSLVALEPETGRVLAIVSAPSYDPNQMTGRDFSGNYLKLESDSLKPLFNRPIQAKYPPGSMFKTVQSLIALQEGVVSSTEEIYSDGRLIGDLAPNGYYDVKKAITYSSNNYFYKVFKRVIEQGDDPSQYLDSRIGFEKWYRYIKEFGLGDQLGIDLTNENAGFIPTLSYHDRVYGENRWEFAKL
jgi:penicillin-binding protein 2